VTTLPPPAEWAHHKAVWIGFPSHADLWLDDLEPARDEVVAFASAVHADGRGETVILVAADEGSAGTARRLAPFAEVVVEPFGDIWLRDTAPIIVGDGTAHQFVFNGWGGKYDLPGDDTIGRRLAESRGKTLAAFDWVLEGGAVDGDGTGVVVTTEQCLLNRNRNPDLDKAGIEARLKSDLGFSQVVWLGDGLVNDHTDGHVDNLARFVGINHLVIPEARNTDDPNAAVYADARERSEAFGYKVTPLPSVGRFEQDGEPVPASYMNFYIGNTTLVVPTYGSRHDDDALAELALLFPDRKIAGLPADAVLTGGGSFHCSSQQVPY
jgi:agmatine deiminase